MILAQIKYFVDKKYYILKQHYGFKYFHWYFKKTSKSKHNINEERFYNSLLYNIIIMCHICFPFCSKF